MLYQILSKRRILGKKVAVVGAHRSLTYERLYQEVQHLALHLQGLGLGPGNYALIGVPPCPDFYVLFYAAAAIGVTAIPVPASGKISPYIESLGPIFAVGDSTFIRNIENGLQDISGTLNWDRRRGLAIPTARRTFSRRKIIRKENVIGVFTSGTTGEPNLDFRSAEVLRRRSKLRADSWGITREDVLLSTGPFTSGVNVDFHLVLPLVIGCKVVVMENFYPRTALEAIAKESVSVICSVPVTFELLADCPARYAPDLSSVRLCIANGAPLARSVYDDFQARFGLPIGQMYGGSHITPVFTLNRGAAPDAVGHRFGPFPVEIVNRHRKPLPPGRIGEIVFDITKVKDRALRAELLHKPSRKGRYLHTGDLGRLDRDGNLFIVGRKSRLIKVGARRVIPAEVEAVLRLHPKVKEAIIHPIHAGENNERVGAVVVSEGDVSAEELILHCAERLDGYQCPKKIVFRRNLPRNAHGKVIRYLGGADGVSKA